MNKTMRIVAHLDMDAFFAAIEERDNPRFKGLPIVVGADPKSGAGRGVVSTANYKAREYGIHSAMPISTAWRLSEEARRKGGPAAVFMGVGMRRYGEVSGRVMAILRIHVPIVEEASVDEAYLDVSFTGSYEKAEALAKKIKQSISDKERLTASVGIGPNKLIAKIASGRHKPDGLTVVRGDEAEAFLAPLPIREIPGIGPKTEELFLKLGVRLVQDLKKYSKDEMREMLGKWGADLYEKVRGRDASPLVEEWEAKSIGEQETFEQDTKDLHFVTERLQALARTVVKRLGAGGFKTFRTVVLTVRFSDFETKTRSRTLETPTDSYETLEFETMKLLLPFFDKRENPRKKLIRLIGVRVEKLSKQ
ncbi:MAG: hypothetical protein A3A43_03580 [Candidatus Liptonbacteria bacterium RIFCSPLOWO2_01_FULL_56_20]|uniref:DNA polymerase IV n=1 Tax=Candidatus Liptonbacteria bacterium RIFCSPLOWO2_01_FULL_56_20 TaxID=1798652 RepID=A0A1G2CJB5_9BACT|nr:MAG: polymerase IV 2 protein [Parcubacteria group bacterium GW2011_GWB1_56_8]OGY97844.1 MAG: hypothetical protein A2681_02485 [Candidatus Liptonbacteria bacterium RIFCSPHIGHO2_01_FULL_56_18b]OGZ01337.1 MAG: hypothetical protein A3A43_03580 [Candidatus Liptonbacteria bacterium RIFCSPLOWO2_01_FULL_56_20]